MTVNGLPVLVPTPEQLRWQTERQFALFFHFGVNTFNDREWSDGSLPAESFNPTALDCREWVDVAKRAGASHVILTAKHHDGFCLWPTSTTDYSVKSSPWQDGQGDVVRELADACAEAGIGLGLYLSPWDRNSPDWGTDPEKYDAVYEQQLTELCTEYGELVEVWFDGAGSEHHAYDWPGIMAIVKKHQPQAMIFNMGEPTIRWVGNEDGLAADPCWYVTTEVDKSMFVDEQDDLAGARYLPPECDVAIRRNWFWQSDDIATLKSEAHLEAIWYRSVGYGANLLLNVPPDRRGLLDDRDVERLLTVADTLRARFAKPIDGELSADGNAVRVRFPQMVTIDHLVLKEELSQGQRVTGHAVTLPNGSPVVTGVQTIGSQRVHAFAAVTTDEVLVHLEGESPTLRKVSGHQTGVEVRPALEDQPAMAAEKLM